MSGAQLQGEGVARAVGAAQGVRGGAVGPPDLLRVGVIEVAEQGQEVVGVGPGQDGRVVDELVEVAAVGGVLDEVAAQVLLRRGEQPVDRGDGEQVGQGGGDPVEGRLLEWCGECLGEGVVEGAVDGGVVGDVAGQVAADVLVEEGGDVGVGEGLGAGVERGGEGGPDVASRDAAASAQARRGEQ